MIKIWFLLYYFTIKKMEFLRAILNKSWRQRPTKQQLYGHQPPFMKTIKVRRTKYAVHCWRSRYELIRDVPLWTPSHGRAKIGLPARTYIQQFCVDTGCSPEDLPEGINDREGWRECFWHATMIMMMMNNDLKDSFKNGNLYIMF